MLQANPNAKTNQRNIKERFSCGFSTISTSSNVTFFQLQLISWPRLSSNPCADVKETRRQTAHPQEFHHTFVPGEVWVFMIFMALMTTIYMYMHLFICPYHVVFKWFVSFLLIV